MSTNRNMAITATTAAMKNNDLTPNMAAIKGPRINAIRKELPIPIPKKAIDFVRTSFLVASANKAVSVAEIAPAPCKKRPAITP